MRSLLMKLSFSSMLEQLRAFTPSPQKHNTHQRNQKITITQKKSPSTFTACMHACRIRYSTRASLSALHTQTARQTDSQTAGYMDIPALSTPQHLALPHGVGILPRFSTSTLTSTFTITFIKIKGTQKKKKRRKRPSPKLPPKKYEACEPGHDTQGPLLHRWDAQKDGWMDG